MLVSLGALLLLVLGVAGWVGSRALVVRDSLQEARTAIKELPSAVAADPTSVGPIVDRITTATERARSAADDPLWRATEGVPVVGRDLVVVRQLTGLVDDIATQAVVPLASLADTITPDSLRPVDGRIDLAPIAAAAGTVATADDAVVRAQDAMAAISADGTLAQVVEARDELSGAIDEAASMTATLRSVTSLAPGMMGADGPRNYLLMIQNNAEARSLGGNPAALVLLRVDDGAISIAAQGGSLDFPRDDSITPDRSIYDVYYPHSPSFIMDTTTRPDFPTAAQLVKGFWEKYRGDSIDGVVSFDPVALGYLMKATGPISLPSGDTLTSDDAATFLMNTVYSRYTLQKDQDAFFATTASTVFDALRTGAFKAPELVQALERASDEHRFMLWSAKPEEQAVIQTTPIAGILPTSNDEETQVGVFLMDRSVSKMSFYLHSASTITSRRCGPNGPEFVVSTTLSSTLDPSQAAGLPSYVAAGFLPRGQFYTDAYLVGPPGTTASVTGGGGDQITVGSDLGRPIVGFAALLGPLESKTFEVVFQGTPDATYGPLTSWVTPLVHPVDVTVADDPC